LSPNIRAKNGGVILGANKKVIIMNPGSKSVVWLFGAYRIMSRERGQNQNGYPMNIHTISKATYSTFEEACAATLKK